VRHPERAALGADLDAAEPIAVRRADVLNEAERASALAGSDAAVNAVGHYRARTGDVRCGESALARPA
jgi:putative NADH-flavin reductase